MRPIKHITEIKKTWVRNILIRSPYTYLYLLIAKCMYTDISSLNSQYFEIHEMDLCYSRNIFLRQDTKIKSNIRKTCSNRIKICTIKSTFYRLLDKLYTYLQFKTEKAKEKLDEILYFSFQTILFKHIYNISLYIYTKSLYGILED